MSLLQYSDELKNVIGKPPSKFIRVGSVFVLVVLVLLISVSILVSYPEEQRGDCIIYTDPLPGVINISDDGTLQDIFVNEGDSVGKNMVIGILKCSASYPSIQLLDSIVKTCLRDIDRSEFSKIYIPTAISGIGDLQEPYKRVYWNYVQLRVYLSDPFFKFLKFKKESNDESIDRGLHQFDFSGERFQEYQKALFEVINNFIQSVQVLHEKVKEWEHKYLLSAPTSGRLFFTSTVFRNMQLQAGASLAYIIPFVKVYYAQVSLGQELFPMIRIGQKVHIALPGFPNDVIEGSVTKISPIISEDGKFHINVRIDRNLLYQIDKQIDLRNELHGTATVIIGKKSLFRKILIE